AVEPSTGKILCLLSKPDFDPNTIAANWESITGDPSSSVLLNRATQGLYPPGSTFKIITALAYLADGGKLTDTYDCEGVLSYEDDGEDATFHCYKNTAHGHEDFKEAIGNSCNCAFAEIGLTLKADRLRSLCAQLLFNDRIPTTLKNVKKSAFVLTDRDDAAMKMQTAFGQGETLAVPMHMAMIVAAIANDGELMRTYDIDRIQNSNGSTVRVFAPRYAGTILTKEQAATARMLMRYVVTDGTGGDLNVDRYTAYGKTGTAEYNDAKDAHSWFIGYAEKDGRKIALAVVMEGAGSGSGHALPLAKRLFDTYFK
ncbi:MAG: penicillin-binding protein 2, partial [Lachnospiraceae bacterium]|nr:penicillin-binding protein 2 [Lachnospiraceae bacterium]